MCLPLSYSFTERTVLFCWAGQRRKDCGGSFHLGQVFLRNVGGVGAVGGGGDDLAQGLGADVAHGEDAGQVGPGGLVGQDVAAVQLSWPVNRAVEGVRPMLTKRASASRSSSWPEMRFLILTPESLSAPGSSTTALFHRNSRLGSFRRGS